MSGLPASTRPKRRATGPLTRYGVGRFSAQPYGPLDLDLDQREHEREDAEQRRGDGERHAGAPAAEPESLRDARRGLRLRASPDSTRASCSRSAASASVLASWL